MCSLFQVDMQQNKDTRHLPTSSLSLYTSPSCLGKLQMMSPLPVLSSPCSIKGSHGFFFLCPLDRQANSMSIQHMQLRACLCQSLVVQESR